MKTCFKIMMRMLKNYEKEIRNSWEKIRKLSGNIVDWEYAKHKIPRVNLRLAHSTREVRWDFTIRYTKNALLIFRKSLRRDLQLPKDVRNSPRRLEKQFLVTTWSQNLKYVSSIAITFHLVEFFYYDLLYEAPVWRYCSQLGAWAPGRGQKNPAASGLRHAAAYCVVSFEAANLLADISSIEFLVEISDRHILEEKKKQKQKTK